MLTKFRYYIRVLLGVLLVGASGWIEAGIVRVGLEDLVGVLILPHLPADPCLAALPLCRAGSPGAHRPFGACALSFQPAGL